MGEDGLLRGFGEALHGGLQPLAPLLRAPRLGAQRLDLVPGRLQRLLRRDPYALLCLNALSSQQSSEHWAQEMPQL